jgi:citrate synthase
VATAVAAAADPLRADLRPEAVRAAARGLLATLAGALGRPAPAAGSPEAVTPQAATEEVATPVVANPNTGTPVVANPNTGTRDGDGVAARATASLGADHRWDDPVGAAVVLLADHELATSTLAARVAASARADPYQVVLAGLAAVSGPLHGSASTLVVRLLLDAERDGPEPALAAWLHQVGRLPGVGQPLYPQGDPRAPLLLDPVRRAVALGARDRPAATPAEATRLEVVEGVAAAIGRRWRLAPNIDYAVGSLVFIAGLHPGTGEALFALARSAGWVAHALEEYAERPLRFRVRGRAPVAGRAGDASRPPDGHHVEAMREGR